MSPDAFLCAAISMTWNAIMRPSVLRKAFSNPLSSHYPGRKSHDVYHYTSMPLYGRHYGDRDAQRP